MTTPVSDRFERPLRDLRISVTDRCNFRCPYCMPAEVYGERYRFMPRAEMLSFEEIERLARIFVGLGVSKLRLTGGEPLLRAQLPELVRRLASLGPGVDLALTTNAVLLAEQAQALRDAGLQRLTISLDSLDAARFARTSGVGASLDRVLAGLAAAEATGFAAIKLNCVVRRGVNDEDVLALARRFHGTPHVVRFIEFMDVGTLNDWDASQVMSCDEIVARVDAELPLEPVAESYRGEVARRYRYRDGGGEIGVIASVSKPFCGDCTRVRLSTAGTLVTCLFAAGGVDLRAPLRAGETDDQLAGRIRAIWGDRRDRYSEQRAEVRASAANPERIEMFQIGG